MTTAGFTMGMRGRRGSSGPVRGVTFIELLVVLSIITIFSVILVAGFKRMQSGFAASSALTRVDSALHYARNLAIANNAVYHVRFETCDTDPTSPTPNALLPQQAVGIYCFQDMATAMTVGSETSPNVQHGWNPFKTLTNHGAWSSVGLYDIGNVVAYSGLNYECVSPVSQPPVYSENDPNYIPPTVYPSPDTDTAHWTLNLTTVPHNNTLVEKVLLPQGTYTGIQFLSPAQQPFDTVLFFRPDGTASSAMTIFVTDEIEFADNRALAETSFNALQDTRRKFFNDRIWTTTSKSKQPPWLKMIQVFKGGLIKQRAAPTATNNGQL